MTPTDPRHGTRAGYIAGCREDCCRVPHVRYQKWSALRRLRYGSAYADRTATLERLAWWAQRGVTPRAVAMGAGVSESTLQAVTREDLRPTRDTERRTLAVTWNDLPDTALVNADISRARIYSLMAAGHPLTWICAQVPGLNVGGKWREQERVTLALARGVLAVYQTAPTWGPSKQTAVKAQRRGHQTPAAWDDPGVPAMPHGWKPDRDNGSNHRRMDDIDEAVIQRVLDGERLPTTRAERDEITRQWRALGRPLAELERSVGITKPERYGREGAA